VPECPTQTTPTPDPFCCNAIEAACEACKAGVTEDEYCRNNPTTMGCK